MQSGHPGQILVVDGDPEARRQIVRSLEERSFRCHEAGSARSALEFLAGSTPEMILLDTVLPDVSGLGLCRMLRESPESGGVPIMVVASHASEIDRILAFEAGADDFLPKPFYPAELSARVSAVLRGFAARSAAPPRSVREGEGLQVNRASGLAALRGQRLDLTPKEFELLAALAAQPGRVIKREQLIERVWGPEGPRSERAVDAHIKSIRRKLGQARARIETVRGVGYRFSEG